jgi:hypothetical protein
LYRKGRVETRGKKTSNKKSEGRKYVATRKQHGKRALLLCPSTCHKTIRPNH